MRKCMMFNKRYSDWFLTESVLDIPRDGLDQGVFQFPEQGAPMIHPRIKLQILEPLKEINKIITILDYFVIGSILTPKYNSNSDIDVVIEVEEELPAIKREELISLLTIVNGKLATGTTHPINYYIVNGQYDLNKTEAAYDIANDKWLKEPEARTFNVKKYVSKLKSEFMTVDLATAELRRDLIDFNELKTLSNEDVKGINDEIQKLIEKIEIDIENIIQTYLNARTIRKAAFDRAMTPAEIRKFGIKNQLPENILYKLLERYFYKDLAVRLRELLDDGITTKSDVAKVQNTFKDFITRIK